ncbi:zinc finger protein 658B-like [Achroia grisella]|uniref:zinc finger protein 658B-like n=1 Tax=Achroia grisella TaxID=688607 RepID=UPI0027D22298|nr:zinc finger protein 658B-like [Achroia grisella]
MARISMCRVCLTENVRMHVLTDTPLQGVYEKLTNTSLMSDVKPITICYLCYSQLNKCWQFVEKSMKANELLTQILGSDVELTEKSLTTIDRQSYQFMYRLQVSPVEYMSIDAENNLTMVKEELGISYERNEEVIKCETVIDSPEKCNSQDSEDDVPLHDISTKKRDRNRLRSSKILGETVCRSKKVDGSSLKIEESELNGNKRKTEMGDCGDDEEQTSQATELDMLHTDSEDEPLYNISNNKAKRQVQTRSKKGTEQNRKFKRVNKMEAREIILTKDQQLQELMERSKSLNFLNSPYKCDLCYKGFVDLRAYENHKEKHDERRGGHECGVCRLRYGSSRQLRAHAAASHARRYACHRCDHRAHTANQAREHEKWHNGYTYECQLCSHKFRKPTSYLTHMRKRHPTEHVCVTCGASFVGRHGLLMHQSKTHGYKKNISDKADEPATDRFCVECNIQFASVEAWKWHVLSSVKHKLTGENSAVCGICDTKVSAADTRAHLRRHLPAQPPPPAPRARLSCEQCGGNFVNRSKLQAHIKRVHLGLKYNKNIVCEVCGKKCTSNASLRYHQRTHTGEKPYSCATCSKRFSDNNQLRIHTRTHTGERPYCCAACGKRFSQKPALNRHYRVHTGAKPYECQFCSKTFSQSNSLKLHVRTVHLKMPPNNKRNKVQNQEDAEKKTEEVTVQAL